MLRLDDCHFSFQLVSVSVMADIGRTGKQKKNFPNSSLLIKYKVNILTQADVDDSLVSSLTLRYSKHTQHTAFKKNKHTGK